jgi:hypothetical protein
MYLKKNLNIAIPAFKSYLLLKDNNIYFNIFIFLLYY